VYIFNHIVSAVLNSYLSLFAAVCKYCICLTAWIVHPSISSSEWNSTGMANDSLQYYYFALSKWCDYYILCIWIYFSKKWFCDIL